MATSIQYHDYNNQTILQIGENIFQWNNQQYRTLQEAKDAIDYTPPPWPPLGQQTALEDIYQEYEEPEFELPFLDPSGAQL